MSARRRTILIAAAIVVCLGLGLVAWRVLAGGEDATAPAPAGTSPSTSPSTTPEAPDPSPEPSSPPSAPAPTAEAGTGADGGTDPVPGATRTVTVTVAGYSGIADTATVTGYVDVLESDGTCRLVLTGNGTTATYDAPAAQDATTTSCAVDVPGASLTSGTWTATLSYSSHSGSGSSAPVTFEVLR